MLPLIPLKAPVRKNAISVTPIFIVHRQKNGIIVSGPDAFAP
jgi:hypothetical protein